MAGTNGAVPDGDHAAVATAPQTRSNRIANMIGRGLKRRRLAIDAEPALRQLVITIRFHPSSGNIRTVTFDIQSEEYVTEPG